MSSRSNGAGESADGLAVVSVVLDWSGKKYKLDSKKVIEAFDSAEYGAMIGPNARWFLEIDGDMKSLVEVLKKVVNINDDEITLDMLELFSSMLESLGFIIRDRKAHHIM